MRAPRCTRICTIGRIDGLRTRDSWYVDNWAGSAAKSNYYYCYYYYVW